FDHPPAVSEYLAAALQPGEKPRSVLEPPRVDQRVPVEIEGGASERLHGPRASQVSGDRQGAEWAAEAQGQEVGVAEVVEGQDAAREPRRRLRAARRRCGQGARAHAQPEE